MAGRSAQEVCLEHWPCGHCSYLTWMAYREDAWLAWISDKRDLFCHLYRTAGGLEVPQHRGAVADLRFLASTPEHPALRPLTRPCPGDPGLCCAPQLLPDPSFPGSHGKLGGDPDPSLSLGTPPHLHFPQTLLTSVPRALACLCVDVPPLSFDSFSNSFLHCAKQFPAACLG